jgi:uncharacterized membrane protein
MNMKNWKDWAMIVLATIIVLGVLATTIILMKWQVPIDNNEPLFMILGALIASFSSVVQYFFGSSKGSSEKTELLKNNGKLE